MSDHLTPESLFEFIDQGGGSGPSGTSPLVVPSVSVRAGLSIALRGPSHTRGGGRVGENPGGYLGGGSSAASEVKRTTVRPKRSGVPHSTEGQQAA